MGVNFLIKRTRSANDGIEARVLYRCSYATLLPPDERLSQRLSQIFDTAVKLAIQVASPNRLAAQLF